MYQIHPTETCHKCGRKLCVRDRNLVGMHHPETILDHTKLQWSVTLTCPMRRSMFGWLYTTHDYKKIIEDI